MADAAVEFLLDNLQQLLRHHARLISDAKNQVQQLMNDLRLFRAFLKDSSKKRRMDDCLRELIRQIRDVVNDANDIIDAFVTQAAESKSKDYFLRAFHTPAKLLSIAKDVEKVGAKVRDFYSLIGGEWMPEEPEDYHPSPILRLENMVGFDDEAEALLRYLTEETEQLDVISIIGMPGLGKTTLAGKIFRDPAIQYEFPIRIWIYISHEFTKKDVFVAILGEFTRLTEDMHRRTDEELAQQITSHLDKEKFLIVMDDVWTARDWDELKIALPKGNKMGKVLITSRNEDVARYANRSRKPHKLRFLTQDESWLLLQLEVFGKRDVPPELEVLGKLIAEQCDGLPLALVAIGGILVKNSASGSDEMDLMTWTKVCKSFSTYLYDVDPHDTMRRSMHYDKLDHYLQACFLYLGMFPKDFRIPVWKLIRMWIGEGFIPQRFDYSLEETAESYLMDLIRRNLVRIENIKPDGKVKTCSIHPMVRDFCRTVAGNEKENFLQEMKSSGGNFDVSKSRRLCVHSEFLNFIYSKPFGPRVRSLVCFSEEETDLPPENSLAIPEAFKLLRVLDVKPIQFTKIPSDL